MSHKMALLPQLMAGKPGGGPKPLGGEDTGPTPAKPAASKANETSDKTMDTVRQGGNTALGGGGKNQYA